MKSNNAVKEVISQLSGKGMKTASECLLEATRAKGEYLLGHEDGRLERTDYAQVLEQALRHLATLQALNVAPGSIIIIKCHSRIAFISILWACILGDYIALPIETETENSKADKRVLEHILSRIESHPSLYIIDNDASRATTVLLSNAPQAQWISLDNVWTDGLTPPMIHRSLATAPRILIPTSGTTGQPSLVELSDRAVRARWWPDSSTIRSHVIHLSWAPVNHTMGLSGCSPNAKKKIIIHPTSFIKDPLIWLRLADQHRVSHCSMTNFGMRLVTSAIKKAGLSALAGIDLSCIKAIGMGAEAIQSETLLAFSEVLDEFNVDRNCYSQGYGLTECGPIMSGQVFNKARDFQAYSLALTDLMQGHEIRINQNQNLEFAAETSGGLIQVRGPSMASSYYGDVEGTKQLFSDDGWINTGDLGRFKDGVLELTGRLKETIILNARKYPSRFIELTAEEVNGVDHAYAIQPERHRQAGQALSGYVLFVCSAMPNSFRMELADKVNRRLGEFMGVAPTKIYFVAASQLPRTPIGKIKRRELAAMALGTKPGERPLTLVSVENHQSGDDSSNYSPSEQHLAGLWSSVLGHSSFDRNTNFFDCGGDSLKAGELLSKMESWLDRSIPIGDLFRFNTVKAQNKSIVCGYSDCFPGLPTTSEFNLGEQAIWNRQLDLIQNWPGYRKYSQSLVFRWRQPKELEADTTSLFWCFQGAHEFERLAAEVGPNIALYGMRSGHLSFENSPDNIDTLATILARELRDLKPSGSFLLGGNCQAARIMQRVAEVLTDSGRHVQHLILMEEREIGSYSVSPVTVIFGAESEFNPFSHTNEQAVYLNFKKSYCKGYRYHEISGSHGRFFNPEHVASLGRIIAKVVAKNRRSTHAEGTVSHTPLMASVVISVGDSPYVVDAVRSLLLQVPQPEILVVSTGGKSPQKRLEAAGMNVAVIHRKWRRFVGTARNIGIEATTAPYISYLADDCIAMPNWVFERLRLHLEGAAAVSSALVPSSNRCYWAWINHLLLYCRRLPGTPTEDTVHYGMSFERRIFRSYGYFREDLRVGEDTDYLTRIGKKLKLTWAPSVVTAHRHPRNLIAFVHDRFKRGRQYEAARDYFSWTGRRRSLVSWSAATKMGLRDRLAIAKLALTKDDRWILRFARHSLFFGLVVFNAGRIYQRSIGGQTNQGRYQKEVDGKPVIHALLRFRNEIKYLPGYFRHLENKVDGVIALDDGSSDGSREFVESQPLLLDLIHKPDHPDHVWDEPGDRRRLVETARKHGADWFIVLDADERLETNFRSRLLPILRKAHLHTEWGLGLRLLECWDRWDQVRVDGIWGNKTVPRLFASRYDHEFDDRKLHGSWIPLNANQGATPIVDLFIYHLRMISKADRELRKARYRTLDPDSTYQSTGYEYLNDTSVPITQPLEPGRDIRAEDTF